MVLRISFEFNRSILKFPLGEGIEFRFEVGVDCKVKDIVAQGLVFSCVMLVWISFY